MELATNLLLRGSCYLPAYTVQGLCLLGSQKPWSFHLARHTLINISGPELLLFAVWLRRTWKISDLPLGTGLEGKGDCIQTSDLSSFYGGRRKPESFLVRFPRTRWPPYPPPPLPGIHKHKLVSGLNLRPYWSPSHSPRADLSNVCSPAVLWAVWLLPPCTDSI